MPIVTVKFKLPDEEEEFTAAMEGGAAKAALSGMAEWLRDQYKYQGNETISAIEARGKLYNICEEAGVRIE